MPLFQEKENGFLINCVEKGIGWLFFFLVLIIFSGYFSGLGFAFFFCAWFVVTPVVQLEDGSRLGSSQPLLAQRETSELSQGASLTGQQE